MNRLARTVIIVSGATLALSLGGGVAGADPPGPGSPCGPNRVITTINTCEDINVSCTGYDGMIIGRVDRDGRCVFPGGNGTTW
ncbi:MAG TPA: hypothetical protein PLF91_01875 [Mycolicibacterium fallax]|nr:hypothetical protein [Mycolicibacterium fallax]HSA39312.1 hypothetical protein [Mycobacterium sp.]